MSDDEQPHYSLKVISDFNALESMESQWENLNCKALRHRFLTRFSSLRLNWQRWKTSWRHKLHVVLVLDNENQLVMAAPMVRRYNWYGTFSLLWLSSKTPLYDNVLVDPDRDIEPIAKLFARHLSSLRTCRKLKIDFVYAGSPLHVLLGKAGYNCQDRTFTSSVSLKGTETWHKFSAGKSAKFRQRYNNGRSRIERAGGYRIDILGEEAELVPELIRIFKTKRQWARQRPDLESWIMPKQTEQLFVGLTKSECVDGNAKIIRLTCGDKWLASLLFFLENQTLYMSKYAHSDLMPEASPGDLIVKETLRYAIENGLTEVDLMIGSDNWKDKVLTQKTGILKCRQSIIRHSFRTSS